MKTGALLLVGLLSVISSASQTVANEPPTTRPAGARAQFVENLALGKKQVIVTMGTSLTENAPWVSQFQSLLDRKFPGLATIRNLGRSASSTAVPRGRCGLDMVNAAVAARPDVVFIEYGINDCYLPYEISPEQSRANLNAIIDTILKANSNTEVILQTMNCCKDSIEKHWDHATIRPKLAEYYEIYRDVARTRKLLLIDHYPNWVKVMNESPGRFDEWVPDRIHPNDKGAQECILPTLQKSIGLDD